MSQVIPPALTVNDVEPSWAPRPHPNSDAPNVVLVVLDDTGFAHLGCFGSDIETPNIDALADGGLRFTNFHTTALCSPTRASLLSGRNHHSVGMRFLSNTDTGYSNCRGVIDPDAGVIPEVLGDEGYSTFALGKWHLANMEDCSPAGPMDHWPLQRGFDRFYGFLGGATDQFSPELTIDNRPEDPPSDENYHLSEALVDEAISMIGAQKSTAPDRPFFTYLAFGATHSPHQAPAAYMEKYRGRFDHGWDVAREQCLERQKTLGIVPSAVELPASNPKVPTWDELSTDDKRLFARMQEAFAAFLDHTDDQIGRLVDYLRQLDQLDNTLIVLVSDNGASQEGGQTGTLNELTFFNRMPSSTDDMVAQIDDIGGPNLYNNYPKGWAQAGNTPLRYYKQNTFEGGVRDPLIIHWPGGISDAGGIRDQYHHAIDVMPTILAAAGIEAPTERRGRAQKPVEGVDMSYCFDAPEADSQRTRQYFEMLGHRAIYADGWKAVTMHEPYTSFDDEEWMLFHTDNDFAEVNDLASAEPDKLLEMKQLWFEEAEAYNVLPLDDRSTELFLIRRPDQSGAPITSHRYWPNTPHIDRFVMPDWRNRSFTISSPIERAQGESGVIVAAGARTGGLALYVTSDGSGDELVFDYNRAGRHQVVRGSLAAGSVTIAAKFDKTAEHTGTLSLLVDDVVIGTGEIELLPFRQSMYGMDIGCDRGQTVTGDYAAPNPFQGSLSWVDFSLGLDRADMVEAAAVEFENSLSDQ